MKRIGNEAFKIEFVWEGGTLVFTEGLKF